MNSSTNSKMMWSAAAAAVSLSLVAPMAAAVDVGVGASLYNNGGGDGGYGVSLPLRFGTFTIEPELTFYKSSQDVTYPASPTSNYKYDNSQYTLETGAYWRRQLVPSVETYVGGRVGYLTYKYSYTYPNNPGSSYSYDTKGYYLGPVLGAEYFFNKHFSLGLDVSLLYENSSRKRQVTSQYTQDTDQFNYQTRGRLRFYY